jgi:hypothetical protein
MQVHARLSIIGLRDIAYQAQDLALLVDLNGLVLLRGEIKPTDFGFRERTDCRYRGTVDPFAICEVRDRLERFLTLIKNQNEYPAGSFLHLFRFH